MIQDYNKTKANVLAAYREFSSLIDMVKGDKGVPLTPRWSCWLSRLRISSKIDSC